MEVFVRVIEAGSFSAAARDLNMGQPTVSKTIAGLEDRLGVGLLTRSTRKLSPTQAGTAFYERARRALGEPKPRRETGRPADRPLGHLSFRPADECRGPGIHTIVRAEP